MKRVTFAKGSALIEAWITGRPTPPDAPALLVPRPGGIAKSKVRARLRRQGGTMARRFALGLLHLVLGFVLVAGVLRGGHRYFYCEAMGLLGSDPCAQAAADDLPPLPEANASLRVLPWDCCEEGVFPPSLDGVLDARHGVPAPPLVAILATSHEAHPVSATVHHRASRLEQWRLPPRPPGSARAQLMIFLT